MTTVYDDVPYENLPFTQALPMGHATIARLHGLTPADPRSARVLELGCGAGAHLAGVAAAHPGVRAVGVDLAPSAIEVARATAEAAKLENVRFDVADVLALTDGQLGEFDYVIVHGLYAWAHEPLREAVLGACRSHLAPDGIVYVSYNSHPGGHLRQMLREMGHWHARGITEPRAQAERARELFTMIDRLRESGRSFYEGIVGEEVTALAAAPEALLVHDLLGEAYAPVWFSDFAAAAERHGMAYVGDAIPEASRETLLKNPLRVLDSKRGQDAPIVAAAPTIDQFWSPAAAEHFATVQSGLHDLGIPFRVDMKLVRGLDYYRRTTFEFQGGTLDSAQNALGGGGRYDGLVEDLGGPSTAGIGFALGVDRTLLACSDEGVFAAPDGSVDVSVVDTTGGRQALLITTELRGAGISADRAFDGRSMKSQMKAADRSGARWAVLVGSDELAAGTVTLRPLRGGEQASIDRSELISHLKAAR